MINATAINSIGINATSSSALYKRVTYPYAITFSASVRATYPYAITFSARAVYPLGTAALHAQRISYPLGVLALHAQRISYDFNLLAAHTQRSVYCMDFAANKVHQTRGVYPHSLSPPVVGQSFNDQPSLSINGSIVQLIAAHFSCDEGQSVWLADIALANREDYARAKLGDTVTLVLQGETYITLIDGKSIHREWGNEQYALSAISPLGFKGSPWAEAVTYPATVSVAAKVAVESVLGLSVIWALPDWIIPAGALAMINVTPLQAAKSIIEAIGGLIESLPDGSVHCRFRYPVNIPDYATAIPDHSFFDNQVVSSIAKAAPSELYNRVTVSNNGIATVLPDKLESVNIAGDDYARLIRAYPDPWRSVLLLHTGNANTHITAMGVVSRVETEELEFIKGVAQTAYPIDAIASVTWIHTNLGAVSFLGNSLTAAVDGGYSLARIIYTVKSFNWIASLNELEAVQFLLVDTL